MMLSVPAFGTRRLSSDVRDGSVRLCVSAEQELRNFGNPIFRDSAVGEGLS